MSDEVKEMRSGLAFWAPLIAASLALFIVVVDSTMMNVAVPTIVKDLNTNVTAVQGVIALYSLVMASLMLVGSKLGAINGVKRVFIIGVLIYGVGTLVAAVSWNITILALGWSLLEGVGAAMVLPLAYALLVTNYDHHFRLWAMGLCVGGCYRFCHPALCTLYRVKENGRGGHDPRLDRLAAVHCRPVFAGVGPDSGRALWLVECDTAVYYRRHTIQPLRPFAYARAGGHRPCIPG